MSKDDEHTTCRVISTRVGPIVVTVDSAHVLAILFGVEMGASIDSFAGGDSALLQETIDQLDGYFSGELKHFDLPLNPTGTAFQKRVWEVMRTID
jgi:methylated-DNA-[protein]-cysteine S-methyltransferase